MRRFLGEDMMKKEELLRHVGSMQQVAYARRLTFGEGRSRGMEAVEVKNGPLRYTVDRKSVV